MTDNQPPIVARAADHADRTAIVEIRGHDSSQWLYRQLDETSRRIAAGLLAGRADLEESRVAFLCPPGFEHAAVQWGIWRAGGIAVPLAPAHPPAEHQYVMGDAEATAVVVNRRFAELARPPAAATGARVTTPAELEAAPPAVLPAISSDRRAMIVYTSGTTGKPKGVVTTHGTLTAQITSLITAWEWTQQDRILLVLPLHHVHGIVNVLSCALWSGACCETLERFDPELTWSRLGSGELTLFMAVPTIYRRLITAWEAAPSGVRQAWSGGCRRVRLMVSGSAALPVGTLERWQEISGHLLLERYGMTEIGMALSNPLHGERRPGFVGTPLPGVDVRLVDQLGAEVPMGSPGEVEVRGPGVFLEYWHRPEASREAFRDGWFRTGDLAVVENGAYRLLGRSSIDIIKTGGFKVSALEIEEVLRGHAAVAECAVVGVPDSEWGERICVVVELRPGATLSLEELQPWARERLAPYKVPRGLRCVTVLPRNAMGKIVKPDLAALFLKTDD